MTGELGPVLIVTPWLGRQGGGVSEVARLESLSFHNRGIAVEVLATVSSGGNDAADAEGWPDVPIHLFPCLGTDRFKFSPALVAHLLMRKGKGIAHVHGLWMFHGAAVGLWALLRGGRYAVTPHGMLAPWIMARSPMTKAIVSRLFQRALLRRAEAIQALTTTEATEIAAYAGPRAARITQVIPNFVQEPEHCSDIPFAQALSGRRIFLFFGRIHDKKGWRELCTAWDSLCRAQPELVVTIGLVFAGWTDQCPDFESKVADLAAEHNNVIYAGPLFGDDREAAFAAASVFVLPSHSEGLPMAVLEAWVRGLPTLITPECNLPEGFSAGAAIECAAEPESVRAGLERFARLTEAEMEKMGDAAKALARHSFGETVVINKVAHDLLGLPEETHA